MTGERSAFGNIRSVKLSGLALALLLAALIASSQAPKHTLFVWDNYVVSPDSLEYLRPFSLTSLTPPVYHWFVRLAGGRRLESPEAPVARYLTDVPFRQRLEDPYFRVVAAQKVIYMGAVLLLALALGRATSHIVALNIVLFLVLAGLLCQSTEALVTESVAQTWTALLCVAFLGFLAKPTPGWLLSAGVLCVLAYLTRPAAAYAVLVPVWMCWHVRATWREHLLPSLVVLGLIGSAVVFEANRVRAGEEVVTISNSARRYNRFIHAIQLMEDGDIPAIEEGRSRAFARKALARRRAVPGADVRPDLAVTSVIRPLLIEEEVGRTQPDGQPDLSPEAQQIFESIAGPVLADKRLESVALWLRTLGGVVTGRDSSIARYAYRIPRPFLFSYLRRSLLAFVVVGPLAIWLSCTQPRRWVRTFVWGLLSLHAANAVIMVVFLYPQARYLNATELFVFIAAAVALWARQPWLGRHASHHA